MAAHPDVKDIRDPLDYIIAQSRSTLKVDEGQLQEFLDVLQPARRVFLYGRGRSGFVARAFAVRLMHLGFQTYVVGETITAPVKRDDVVILVSGSGTTGINVQGNFYVNEGALGASAQCANRTNANGTLPAHLVIDAGQFTSSTAANVRMCQTFVLLSKSAPYQQSIGSGSVSNTCTIAAPCPTSVNNGNFLSMFGNTIDWTAPNEFSVALMSYDDRHAHPYEDLAFWAETSNLSQIKGQGAVHTEGVFFLPNADMVLQGQATQLQALNAQFISKTLNISGQGTLNLKPNPADSVQILQASYSLIR